MKLLVLLALVGLTTAAVYQHSLSWSQSKRSKLIKSGQWPAYLKYKEFLRTVKAHSKFSNLKSVGQKVNDYEDPIDGILGLAFTSLAEGNAIPPLINAVNQGLLDKPLFTVYLQERGNQDNVPGGVYTYGAVDTQNCGDVIAYQKLSSATYFQFAMDQIGAGSYSSSQGWDVISDTGTSFIGGPQDVTDALANAVGATYDDEYGTYFVDCNVKFSGISITIGGKKYNIDSKQVLVDAGNGQCEFAFFPFDFGGFGPAWILGDPWIRQYCNIYSFDKQIGFAPTKK
ncbi:hypothetical protein FO519_005823 [Halicephalobus sp. NKZ332]|nr:hypothetical protein FO519_005823 [Halicephalobus sp. NKZ332]